MTGRGSEGIRLESVIEDATKETIAQEEEMKKQENKDDLDLNALKNQLKALEATPHGHKAEFVSWPVKHWATVPSIVTVADFHGPIDSPAASQPWICAPPTVADVCPAASAAGSLVVEIGRAHV